MDDQKHGDWKVINPDDGRDNSGRVQEIPFVQGREHGLAKISWPGGQTLSLPYERGSISGRSVRRFADGSKVVGDFVDSEKNGAWKHYKSDGPIWKEETYSKGKLHGPYYEFGEHCKSEGNYVEGQKDGDWMECGFRVGKQGSYAKGLKQGRWEVKHYDEKGSQEALETQWYEAGKETGTWTYKEICQRPHMREFCLIKSKTPYVDGKRHDETIIRRATCKCWSQVYDNGEWVSNEEEWKSRCRRELDW